MDTKISELKLELINQVKANDLASTLLAEDSTWPFKQVIDQQDLIEQRILLIWVDISSPQMKRSGYVGFCTLNVCDEFIELYRFFVAPSFRRLGIGRLILQELAKYITPLGFNDFYIELTSPDAVPFWTASAEDFTVTEAGYRKWKLSF